MSASGDNKVNSGGTIMKKILVTGCNGQLGRAINQEYDQSETEFINTDVQAGEGVLALDITDIDEVLALVREKKPDVIDRKSVV